MEKLKVTLTEDMIRLISCINFQEYEKVTDETERHEVFYAIDLNSLYGGNFVFEDIARILDFYDQVIPDTEFLSTGPRYPKEVEDYMWETHCYIVDNLHYIEQILHQYCAKGGITAGTYTSKINQLIWSKE